jgi:hypothetical protein
METREIKASEHRNNVGMLFKRQNVATEKKRDQKYRK